MGGMGDHLKAEMLKITSKTPNLEQHTSFIFIPCFVLWYILAIYVQILFLQCTSRINQVLLTPPVEIHPSWCACWLQGHNTRRCAQAVARPNLEIARRLTQRSTTCQRKMLVLFLQNMPNHHFKQDFSRVSAQHPSIHAGPYLKISGTSCTSRWEKICTLGTARGVR